MADASNSCSRCEEQLTKPIRQNANYVIASDFAEPTEVETVYGLFHTEETRSELDRLCSEFPERDRQTLAAEMANPDAEEFRTVRTDGDEEPREVEFSVPTEKFDWKEIDSANEVQVNDDCALSYHTVEERDVQKTGLVCPECAKDSDEVIWGVDS